MTGVQEHTLQLIWRFCASFERVIGDLQVKRQRQTRMRAGMHACMLRRHSQVVASTS